MTYGSVVGQSNKNVAFEALYEIIQDIGRRPYQPIGSASYMAACEEKSTKHIFAVKVLQKKVKLREVFESDICLHLVLHLVEGEQLFERLVTSPTYNEQFVVNYFRQMCEGLRCLHEYEIVHKNLKPENILLSSRAQDATIKISDASLSTFFTEDVDVELVCCNPIFCAPELLTSRKFDKAYDLWSLGILLYIMLSGCDPYYPKSNGDLYRAILTGDIQFPGNLWDGISRTGRDVVKRLLVLDANQRHTTAQLLKHTWLTDDHILGVNLAATQKRLEEFRLRRQEMNNRVSEKKSNKPSVPGAKTSCDEKPVPYNM
ncbi:Calcium/calmodulin-dependent protein kinase type IV [Paragonimus heterotremus]|uniref:Calcium/calmodulin-dependent protein kinase type IV n=1 Tax=Paragonimus heterotremus TaxID=100268 RepID=A0A8J4SX47_9TREM|nr:Calcium/calmodulin-dependent protein kinase type IV [Paragonimus heterotremus]